MTTSTGTKKATARSVLYYILPCLSIAAVILAWTYISYKRPELFPTPERVFKRLVKLMGQPINKKGILGHLSISFLRVAAALLSGTILGVSFGVLIGWNRTCKALFGTIFEMIRPIPPIAWIPLLIIWFGIGEFPKILIVFIGCFVPIVINTYTGIQMVDPLLLDVGRIFRADNWQILFEIALPSALPAIFAGFRAATSGGWLCLLAAEMMAAKHGLGFLITRGMEVNDTALIFISMVVIGVTGALMSVGIGYLERWICPWREN